MLPMTDKSQVVRAARDFVQGLRSGLPQGIKAKRPGVCIVERCAQLVEETCGGCRGCLRCAIAAELRAAESRINAERDAELEECGIAPLLDHVIEGLCALHAPLGTALIAECYGAKVFAAPARTLDGKVEPS